MKLNNTGFCYLRLRKPSLSAEKFSTTARFLQSCPQCHNLKTPYKIFRSYLTKKTLNLHYKDPSVGAAREIIAMNLIILTKN